MHSEYPPDESMIATGSYDQTTKLWDAKTGELLQTLYGHSGAVTDLAFTPDGQGLYTTSIDGTTRLNLLDLDDLIELAQTRVTRTLTDEECQAYLHSEACEAAQE